MSALRIPPSSTSLTDTTRPGLRAKPLLPGLVEELQEVENEEELRGLREDKLKAIPVLSPNS